MEKVLRPIGRSDESKSLVGLPLDRTGYRRHTRFFSCSVRVTTQHPRVSHVLMPRSHSLIRRGPDEPARPRSPAGVAIRATRVLPGRPLFGAGALPHERGGHVSRPGTRMLLRDVRGEPVRRDLPAAEPAESLAGRDVDALHPSQHGVTVAPASSAGSALRETPAGCSGRLSRSAMDDCGRLDLRHHTSGRNT